MAYYRSLVPVVDNFDQPIKHVFIDGATRFGPWAIMTPASHLKYGVGLGVGRGQKYIKQVDGRWHKVELGDR